MNKDLYVTIGGGILGHSDGLSGHSFAVIAAIRLTNNVIPVSVLQCNSRLHSRAELYRKRMWYDIEHLSEKSSISRNDDIW